MSVLGDVLFLCTVLTFDLLMVLGIGTRSKFFLTGIPLLILTGVLLLFRQAEITVGMTIFQCSIFAPVNPVSLVFYALVILWYFPAVRLIKKSQKEVLQWASQTVVAGGNMHYSRKRGQYEKNKQKILAYKVKQQEKSASSAEKKRDRQNRKRERLLRK